MNHVSSLESFFYHHWGLVWQITSQSVSQSFEGLIINVGK